jgi:DNA (cytosine-5)-methyltransferase 1
MAIKSYYNEIDPAAAQWLRNLITAGHIADGIVDERSIEDVRPDELAGYTQCHFFAGVGVWSYALRQAGWPDERPVWTGSCPCQPFSAAGKGAGFADERHLWPAFQHLIAQRRPATVFGEQVASKAVEPWIDLVHADLEALGYAFGCVPFPSAGVGAPHIRDRAYWCAAHLDRRPLGASGLTGRLIGMDHADYTRPQGHAGNDGAAGRQGSAGSIAEAGLHGGVANVHGDGCESRGAVRPVCKESDAEHGGAACGLGDAGHDHDAGEIKTARYGKSEADRPANIAGGSGISPGGLANTAGGVNQPSSSWADQRAVAGSDGALQAERGHSGPTNGLWRDADWLFCRDGKWRPVMPGTFPLVTGAPARVVRLRAYGNAINAKAAQAFIESVMAC